MTFRDFDAERRERSGELIEFQLGGEKFAVVGGVSAAAVFDLATLSEAEDEQAFIAFRDFLLAVLPGEEEGTRLMAAIRRTRVSLDTLLEVCAYIVQNATGRPSSRPSASRGGSRKGGKTSRVVSLSPGGGQQKSA